MPRLSRRLGFVILGACAATGRADEKPLPAAPTGYVWERAPAAKAAWLRPESWHFKKLEQSHPLQYFITKQAIPSDAKPGTVQYETGVSIIVFRYAPALGGIEVKPSEFARQYFLAMRENAGYQIERKGECKVGAVKGFFVEYREVNKADPLRLRHVAIPNDATGALYLIMFESPARIWETDWPAAETILKQLVIDPKFGGRTAVEYEQTGIEKAQHRQFDGAIADFSKSIALDRGYAPAYRNRGTARGENGDLEHAIADFTKAIELNPKAFASQLYLSYYGRGQIRKRMGDVDGSLEDLSKTIALNPKFRFAYSVRGAIRVMKEDLAGGVADFSKSLELFPQDEDVLCLRAGARYSQSDLAGAIKDCDQAVAINPNSVRALLIRGATRLELGDLAKSKLDFDRCLELEPDVKLAVAGARAKALSRRATRAGARTKK